MKLRLLCGLAIAALGPLRIEGISARLSTSQLGDNLAESSADLRSAEREVANISEARGRRQHLEKPRILNFQFYDSEAPPPKTAHPMWHFEGFQLRGPQVWVCSVVLFLAGILCSAGGIGGGGVYVTVLMVAGGLDISDAVPLSKGIVFTGSIASLILNLRKSFSTEDQKKASLVDFNICRLVIPASLGGTYLGVFLNRVLPGCVISMTLTCTLLAITIMVFRTTWQQYFEEEADGKTERDDAAMRAAAPPPASHADGSAQTTSEGPEASSGPAGKGAVAAPTLEEVRAPPRIPRGRAASIRRYSWHAGPNENMKKQVQVKDGVLTLLVLAVVVLSSSFRFHSAACQNAEPARMYEVCHHPVFQWLGKDTLQQWMKDDGIADFLSILSFATPLALCAMVVAYYNCLLITKQGWRAREVMLYDGVSVATGILAGLVGIGGGLIISPFLIVMNLEPSVAVATSSTCVIFTSSSTTLQYLLTDRIIMSLTLAYGLANLAASYAGTSLVHMIQEKLSRRWYISSIVGAGVFLSTVLALTQMVKHQGGH